MSIRTYGLAFSICCAFAGNAFAQESELLRNWDKVADGVYQQTDADGVVTRLAYGSDGAAYDHARLSKEIQQRSAAAGKHGATDEDVEAIAKLQEALDNVPLSADASVSPMSSTTGTLCDRFNYAFDSSFLVGSGGVDAISRASINLAQDGPIIGVTVQGLHAEASVSPKSPYTTPATVNVVKNTTTSKTLAAAIADWAPTGAADGGVSSIPATRCFGSTYASIQINTSSCSGSAAFVSLSKSYPSCVNTP